jgi:hypothetical protein
MTDMLPDPLVSAEVDLRDFPDMMLDVRKLRDSRFGAEVSADAFRAGVMLWCAAWHQVPCGSVPDDDIELANLAGYGRFVKEWKKSRAQALQGFVKCCDGRLYHETVSAKANAAWIKRLEHYYERARDRLRKANKDRSAKGLALIPEITFDAWNAQRLATGIPMEKADASAGIPPPAPPTDPGIPPETALKGEGTERERERESIKPPAAPPPPPLPAAPTPAVAARVELIAKLKAAEIFPESPALLDPLIAAGVGWDEFEPHVAKALKAAKPFRFLVAIVAGERERAARMQIEAKPEVDWRESRDLVSARGQALGLGAWQDVEADAIRRGKVPSYAAYRSKVIEAAGVTA